MNRIEQVAATAPAQQSQPRLPRALADVRRRAAHALFQPAATAQRARRGTSGLAVALAALAVPLLPSEAFGAAASAGAGAAKTDAPPHTRHHLHHGQVYPGPGAMTVQGWTASGWTLTVPYRPADMDLLGHVLAMHYDGRYVPWLAEPAEPGGFVQRPRPVVLPDGKRGEIAAYRVSHTSPRADDPGVPQWQAPADPVDQVGRKSPTGQSSDGPAAVRAARSRGVPTPLITAGTPANTKQMVVGAKQVADTPHGAVAAAEPSGSPCLRATYLAGKDRHMLAHLHPAVDTMNVVVTRRPTACAAMVDYLSQARA